MIETWYQWTCNGCGITEWHPDPNMRKTEVRSELRAFGWRSYPGDLDYCPKCVANGNARKRVTDMNS